VFVCSNLEIIDAHGQLSYNHEKRMPINKTCHASKVTIGTGLESISEKMEEVRDASLVRLFRDNARYSLPVLRHSASIYRYTSPQHC
jgi:hypothetical protein